MIFVLASLYVSITVGAAEYIQKEKGYGFWKSIWEGMDWPFWLGKRFARIHFKSDYD